MARTAFDTALSYNALDKAWNKLYSKTKPSSRNTVGVDEKSINDFQIDAKGNLTRLHKSILGGDFTFSGLKPYLIPKPNGKKRLICVPTVQDRIIQGALLDFLSTKYGKILGNPVSYGFIKGRGVAAAVKHAQSLRNRRPYVFKTDITAFFDSIPRADLESAAKRFIRDSSLYPLLFQIIASEVTETQASIRSEIERMGISAGKGLRQGMPMSPFLSNILLLDFDRAVDASGMKAVRYADDLIFLCNDEIECRHALSFCKAEFSKIGLSIPEVGPNSKSQIFLPQDSAEFLGLELTLAHGTYDLRVSESQIIKMEQAMLTFGSIPNLVSRGITLRNVGQKLASKRSGYLAAYAECSNYAELEARLGKAEIKALKTLFGQGLGISIKGIGASGRAFLGIVE